MCQCMLVYVNYSISMTTTPPTSSVSVFWQKAAMLFKKLKRLCGWKRAASGASEMMKYKQQIHESREDTAQPLLIQPDDIS